VIDSTLVLFGDGARGLAGGVGWSVFCWGGDDSSPSTCTSDTTKVRDVLVRAVASIACASSSSSLQ
jgi:hypothetical protein